MMFNLKSFILSLFTLLGIYRPTKISFGIRSFSFSSLYITGESNKFDFTVKCMDGVPITVQVLIANDLYPSGKVIFEETFPTSTTRSFEYDNKYTRNKGNEIIAKEITSNSTKTIRQAVDIASSKTLRLSGTWYTYESTSNLYKYNSKSWSISKESIEFYNFDEYYIPDFYHKLDLREFRISVSNAISDSFNYKNGKLSISNYNGMFNSFGRKSEITIPIKLVEEDPGEYHLDFALPLYVNKETLEMSPRSSLNLIETHCFYFPRNQKQNEEEYNIGILLNGVGVDNSNFVLDFKYKSINNIFGDCRNSEYCIVNS